ncbi:nucleotide exchange factor Fes1-domain-containing protein [Xylariaceae sp. FL0255]|nr:nucleotide exchange factor Fes1-domain-containing protein [Xylariaceae sp. FL0255]
MGDRNLNELLKWSIENSVPGDDNTSTNPSNNTTEPHRSQLTPELMAALMGGPSDADLMKAAIECITNPDESVTLETKLTAFDNLEQLIESLDNANLLSNLGLWTPLLECLGHEESEIRLMAAWCVGTAVQNNEPCQERLVALGGVQRLVRMAVGLRLPAPIFDRPGEPAAEKKEPNGDAASNEEQQNVRRKAVYALSSAVRNYQPAMDVAASELRLQGHGENVSTDSEQKEPKTIDAMDMDAVDVVINGLKDKLVTTNTS